MICKIQVVTVGEDGRKETREITSIQRTDVKPETLGLTLAERSGWSRKWATKNSVSSRAASGAGTNFPLPMVRLRSGLTVAMSAGSTSRTVRGDCRQESLGL